MRSAPVDTGTVKPNSTHGVPAISVAFNLHILCIHVETKAGHLSPQCDPSLMSYCANTTSGCVGMVYVPEICIGIRNVVDVHAEIRRRQPSLIFQSTESSNNNYSQQRLGYSCLSPT